MIPVVFAGARERRSSGTVLVELLLEDELAATFGMGKGAVDVGASKDEAVVKVDVARQSRLVAFTVGGSVGFGGAWFGGKVASKEQRASSQAETSFHAIVGDHDAGCVDAYAESSGRRDG